MSDSGRQAGSEAYQLTSLIDEVPVLGICGWSGSGKTTLIEAIIPELVARGLKVAVVKHDAHGIDVDREGKDTDRLYKAGADVLLQGPDQEFFRVHRGKDEALGAALLSLVRRYDLVLVEGNKANPLRKIWLLGDGESSSPPEVTNIAAVLSRDCDRPAITLEFLQAFTSEQWLKTPIFGCVLISGKSARIDTARHLITVEGKTWLERTTELLSGACESVVIAGAGRIPTGLSHLIYVADVPDARGPLAGLLAAMRWAPRASWLVAACDMPALSTDGIGWLLSTRRAGAWASIPKLADVPQAQPLLAHYDFRARRLMEAQVARGNFRASDIAAHPKVILPEVPCHLVSAWRNVNRPGELKPSEG